MGFCRLIYRIGRMIFRDFLFKIPKKYLVVIIVFLTIFLLKTNVFAYSNYDTFTVDDVSTDLVFYKYAWIYNTYIDTMIVGPYQNGNNYTNNYKLDIKFKVNTNKGAGYFFFTDSAAYVDGFNAHIKNRTNDMELVYASSTSTFINTYVADTDYRLFVDISNRDNNSPYCDLFSSDDSLIVERNFSRGSVDFNTSYNNNIKFGSGGALSFENYKIYIYDSSLNNWYLVFNFYPCKYIDTSNNSIEYLPGYYDSVTETFYYFSNLVFNDNDILSDVPEELLPSNPYITNDISSIENWTFQTLDINGGNVTNSTNGINNNFYLVQNYNNKEIILPINNYKTIINSNDIVGFSIPRSILLSDSAIINDYDFSFTLRVTQNNSPIVYNYTLGNYTFNLTQTEQDNINEDKTQQSLDNISQAQQQTTNAINNMNNSITNDNVSSSVIQQPNVPTDTSGVESGVNNIFTVIMNAFTNFDSTQDVVLPIPFTDKNITISGNYTRDMLTNANASWVINFITIFWWYIISVYIVKDVLRTVDKIQEGKIDSVENSNIKGDML